MTNSQDSIFALSTGRGKAGVAIIRISGSKAFEALGLLGVSGIKPRTAHLKKLFDLKTNEILDEAVVIYFPAPNSFTGEDVVELHVHGSIAVINSVLDKISQFKGLRLAEAGEFSRRAFENGRLDLTQIEGLADLIDSETRAQAKQALRLTAGDIGKFYESLRERMIEIRAFTEAFIDFPEEDIPEDLDNEFTQKAVSLAEELSAHLNDKVGERIKNGAVAAIIGEPNVGKSSLMNALSKRDLAIVSDIAGTTRDSIECHLDIKGYPLTLIDTAGIRESSDRIEMEGVKRALSKAKNADIKMIMLSAEEYPDFNSKITSMIDEDAIIIVNKTDLKKIDGEIKFGDNRVIMLSVNNGVGIKQLKEEIAAKVENIFQHNNESIPVTHARHRIQLEEAKLHLLNFIEARKGKLPIELCAEEVRCAANAIGKITGKIDVEDLLDKIFSSFCIGK